MGPNGLEGSKWVHMGPSGLVVNPVFPSRLLLVESELIMKITSLYTSHSLLPSIKLANLGQCVTTGRGLFTFELNLSPDFWQ